MADYAAENVATTSGVTLTERSGTASSDTVAAGSIVLFRNTGAGSHDVTITTNNTSDGLAVADRVLTLSAGQIRAIRINRDWGDANGLCALAIANATPSEVKFYVMGGV